MEDIIDEVLTGKKKKIRKEEKAPVQSKNEEVNLQRIFEDDAPTATQADTSPDDQPETSVDAPGDSAPKDATAKETKKTAEKHVPVGDKVMEVSLSISDVDYGKVEVGAEEYSSITDLSALLGLFDINARDLTDPNKAVTKISLSIEETISSSNKNTVTLSMQMNPDDTMSISVKVGDLGQPFTNIEQALKYFNTQYQLNVWDIINKTLGSK
jgi:hypothetical protein